MLIAPFYYEGYLDGYETKQEGKNQDYSKSFMTKQGGGNVTPYGSLGKMWIIKFLQNIKQGGQKRINQGIINRLTKARRSNMDPSVGIRMCMDI